MPTEQDKDSWATLVADEPHRLHITLKPQLAGQPIPKTSVEEMKKVQAQQFKTRQWPLVRGLEDGQMDKIGIAEGAEVKEWLEGSLEEILGMEKAEKVRTVREGVIKFILGETTEFEMKRADTDGTMDCRGGL